MTQKETKIIKDDVLFGLSSKEVEERIQRGDVNLSPKRITKTYREIFFKSFFTVFNLVITILAILVIPTIKSIGDIGNISFVFTALLNLLIQIIQEIKAKKIIESLTLTTESKVKVLRNIDIVEISRNKIVKDDLIYLEAGAQIPTDSIIVKGDIYVNESLLTGESDDILKKVGEELLSGSYVVSGECYAKVIRVGKDNYIEKLSSQATKYSKPDSEIMSSLNKIITTISIILIPLFIVLYFIYSKYSKFDSETTIYFGLSTKLVLTLISSINGMIPYGLFLLTSAALAVSVVKLAKQKTLVQDIYCIESLARVDTLCLDKTGTITDGTMRVSDLMIVDNSYQVLEILSSMNACLKNNNQTARALRKKFGKDQIYEPIDILNFNSTNKYSAVTFKKIGTFVTGAPEILLDSKKKKSSLKKIVDDKAKKGERVLALCHTKSKIKDNTIKDGQYECVALISIHDNLRKGVKDTLDEFKNNGVDIKIISGDNPITVSAIARDAGIENADNYISLSGLSDDEVKDAATKYTIFGRVTPEQKRILVKALKDEGHKVAMTGDGVNDILALKESNCSIGMGTGTDAVRNVAHLILLDSNFKNLPHVVNEGRRVINNIQRTSALYLAKTIMMILINTLTIAMFYLNREIEFTSPFSEPSQMFIIETFIIGLSSFVLAFEPNHEPVRGRIIGNALRNAAPVGVITFILIVLMTFLFEDVDLGEDIEKNLIIILTAISFFTVLPLISIPYSKFRFFVTLGTAVIVVGFFFFSIWTSYKLNGLNLASLAIDNEKHVLYWSKEGTINLLKFIGYIVLMYAVIFYFRISSIIKQKKKNKKETIGGNK